MNTPPGRHNEANQANLEANRKLMAQQIRDMQGRAKDQLQAAATEGLGMEAGQTSELAAKQPGLDRK